jgi:hypothetical protein
MTASAGIAHDIVVHIRCISRNIHHSVITTPKIIATMSETKGGCMMDMTHASIKMFDLNKKYFDNAFMAASNAQDLFERMMVSRMALSPWFPEETRAWVMENFDACRHWRNQLKAAADGHCVNMKGHSFRNCDDRSNPARRTRHSRSDGGETSA